jgi:AcrR family transcriptional regulator
MDVGNANLVQEKILDATLKVLAEHKISGTRMRMIAEESGMSQGNLHYYFETKAVLFRKLLENILASFVKEREHAFTATSKSVVEKLRVFFNQMKDLLIDRKYLKKVTLDFWVQGTDDDELKDKVQEMYAIWRRDIRSVVEEGVREGIFEADRSDQVPMIMVSLMEGAALQYLIEPESIDLDAYFDQGLSAVLALLNSTDR